MIFIYPDANVKFVIFFLNRLTTSRRKRNLIIIDELNKNSNWLMKII